MQPKLSVILPNFNHADHLPQCLEAILSQSFGDLELVVVDDASTDSSRDVLASCARSDSRVRVFHNPKNLGVIATLNRAMELSRAEYVFGAASDDYVLPGYFRQAMDLFAANPQAGLATGLAECVDGHGRLKALTPGYWSDEPRYIEPRELAPRMKSCGVPGPTIWRRAAFLEAGGYHADLRWHGDWFPLQVVAFRHGVCFVPEPISVVREVADSYSANQGRKRTQRHVLQKLFARMADPAYRDVLWGFEVSGILRQFGPEAVRAAVTMPAFPKELLPALRETTLVHASNLLHEPDDDVNAGLATLVSRFGEDAFHLYDALGHVERNATATATREAARLARRDLRRSVSIPRYWGSRAHRAIVMFARGMDRAMRPLHNRRLERIEKHLEELIRLQQHAIAETARAASRATPNARAATRAA